MSNIKHALHLTFHVVLLTPNIHAHYTDHGQLQFCPIVLEEKVEINFGATIMPLTQYRQGCCLRPHAVTVKGQLCEEGKEYFGNPCKPAQLSQECGVVLFPGQGSVSLFFPHYEIIANELQFIYDSFFTILLPQQYPGVSQDCCFAVALKGS